MADVTLILPPSVVTTVAAGGQQTQSATEAGVTPASLPPGSLVSGTIAGRDTAGNFLLKSALGTLTLSSSVPLTYNSDVVIRLGANLAGNANARIVSVNGEPYSEFATPQPEEGDTVSRSLLAQQPAAAAPAPATTSRLLSAVVISAPPESQQAASAPLTQGTNVVVRLPDSPQAQQAQPTAQPPTGQPPVTAPVSATPQAATTVSTGTPAAAANAAGVPATVAPIATAVVSAPQPSAGPLPANGVAAGAQPAAPAVPVDVSQPVAAQSTDSVPAPAAALQAPAAPVAAQYGVYGKQALPAAPASVPSAVAAPTPVATPATLPAQIISAESSGTITLQTPVGTIAVRANALPAAALISPGTNVTIELPAATAQTTSTVPASLSELAASWQSLKDILSAVSTASPAAGAAFLSHLPQLGENFVSSSFSFLRNLLSGDPKKILGEDTVDTLKQDDRQGLLQKFTGELQGLARNFAAPEQKQAGNWQAMILPFVYQESLEQARLYVKREPPRKDKNGKPVAPDTRFVIEVDLSDIGSLQMDGLLRKKETATAFDLVVRSHSAFSQDDQSNMLAIYNEAAEITGFKGSIAFQVTRDFPVKPLEEAAGGQDHTIVA